VPDEAEPSRRGPVPFDTSIAQIARVYDYWLAGKDNFAADREAAELAIAANPGVRAGAKANRAFLTRAVRYLAAECGIRQFLDIGTGMPTADNTHEVAQSVAPECRVVYVDNDPVVLLHARSQLVSDPAGAAGYVESDLRDTGTILAEAARTLDFSQPVAVLLLLILHLIPDTDDPHGIVGRLMAEAAPGSFLVLTHVAADVEIEAMAEMATHLNRLVAQKGTMRSKAEITRFFDGMALARPGVVQPHRWRPGGRTRRASVPVWSGVARKL
jgi:S-adenosyl methyltransferase